jgi:Fe-S-cluster containining protein
MENLSLLKYCIPCNAKCCKTGKLIGSPILDEEESKEIGKENVQEIITPKGKKYWILKERKENSNCRFLTKDNKCLIQNIKPLDCLCYPIKAVYNKNKIIFINDKDCLAHNKLNKEFIKEAKKIAIKSIKRFDKETYNHWLDNYVGWIKSTAIKL